MSNIFNIELEKQLKLIASFLENDIREILLKKGHNASGELNRSIENVVKQGSNMFTIEGLMAEQGKFIINGRDKGLKGVPIDALVKWIEQKNFASAVNKKRNLAFAIQKSIKQKGIKPDDFISEVFERRADRINNKIGKAVEEALDVSLTNLINKAKKFT